jgi:hypothetical protein
MSGMNVFRSMDGKNRSLIMRKPIPKKSQSLRRPRSQPFAKDHRPVAYR